uniref:Receptor ligand binding region domain-containing protein n=1 Tax=Panagrolaimus davidi TaxID=227884 RepID=A0A914QB97_9BILA
MLKTFFLTFIFTDIDCVSKLVTIWNLPVITYAASIKSEKRASPVSRIAPTTANTLCDSIITIMKELNLDKLVLFYNTGDSNVVSQGLYLIKVLNSENIQSRNFELQSTNITWFEFNGMVNIEEVQKFTRVIILLMGDSLDENLIVLQHLRRAGITASDYVIFLPWINEDPEKSYPWLENTISPINRSATVTVNDNTKKDFIGTYVIDSDNNGTSTTIRFSNLLLNKSQEFTRQNRNKLSRAFVLYDSLKLLILAVNQSYTQMGHLGAFNSTLMLQQISGITFEGASGVVEMDYNNERIPFYSLYEIRDDSDYNIYQIAKISPIKYITESNQTTYYLKMSKLDPPTKDKLKSKTTEPACGFQGYKCDYSKWYVISGTITVIVIAIGIGYYLKKRGCHMTQLKGESGFRRIFTSDKTVAQLSWHIPIEKVEMIKDESPRALSHKSESELSAASGLIRHVGITNETAIVYNNIVKIRRFKQLKNINFDQTEAQFLLSLKQLVHDNINPIIGLCYNNPTNELLVLSKFCSRGTLSEYLHNPEMRMDGKFKTAFLRDIINVRTGLPS